MTSTTYGSRQISLRKVILKETGQDVYRCQGCSFCSSQSEDDQDIPLDSLIQLVMMNDEEVLTCRTLWSDQVLKSARSACAGEINLEDVILTLREEAIKREVNLE